MKYLLRYKHSQRELVSISSIAPRAKNQKSKEDNMSDKNGSIGNNTRWSGDDYTTLIRMTAEGDSVEEIATVLGRSASGVYNKLHQIQSGTKKGKASQKLLSRLPKTTKKVASAKSSWWDKFRTSAEDSPEITPTPAPVEPKTEEEREEEFWGNSKAICEAISAEEENVPHQTALDLTGGSALTADQLLPYVQEAKRHAVYLNSETMELDARITKVQMRIGELERELGIGVAWDGK